MKREEFLQPKDEKKPQPKTDGSTVLDLHPNQLLTINGTVYVVTELNQTISYNNGRRELTFRAVSLDDYNRQMESLPIVIPRAFRHY